MDAHQLELVQQRAKNLSNLYGKPPELFLDVVVTMEFDEAMDRLDEIDAFLSQQAETRTELAANAPEAGRLLRMEREAGVKMESPGRTQTPEERRLRELAVGKRKFEPEDLALFGLGAGLATILPSPADVLYFYVERWLDDHRYDISPTRYWVIRAINYYVTDSAWHWGLLAWILISRKPVKEKAELYFSMVSAGAVVALMFDFIRDERIKRGMPPTQKPQQTTNQAPQTGPFPGTGPYRGGAPGTMVPPAGPWFPAGGPILGPSPGGISFHH